MILDRRRIVEGESERIRHFMAAKAGKDGRLLGTDGFGCESAGDSFFEPLFEFVGPHAVQFAFFHDDDGQPGFPDLIDEVSLDLLEDDIRFCPRQRSRFRHLDVST